MEHLPIFVRLGGQPCLVVGGGGVAARKAELLRRAGAIVTVAAQELNERLAAMRDRGEIRHRASWKESLLERPRLVVAATGNGPVNARVAAAADAAGILCNVVDDNSASRFILPAIVDRSPVTIAIGTGGNAPVLAQQLKSRIERWLPARIGVLAARAGRWRRLVRKRFATLDERRRFWQRFFEGPAAEHILAGRERRAEQLVRRELVDSVRPGGRRAGEAYIVGAGPGDPGLVTIRAQQLIGQADVVLYDRLVSPAVLDYARKEAERIDVGKTAGRASPSQEQINELLVRKTREGKRVCRLKGGDPFVFGRGGEEARALAAAGLPFQVVPGITAALGAAAYAGIPLTMRGMSGSMTLASAKLAGGAAPDWRALARAGQTLVFYMSAGTLDETAGQLLRHGLAAETPAAVIENATTDRQRVIGAGLSRIAAKAHSMGLAAPAILFVGETAALAGELAWFEPGDRLFCSLSAAAYPRAPLRKGKRFLQAAAPTGSLRRSLRQKNS
ncbi:MAG TPA: siroheme synthase CysG [Woeseiaceae bacterium]|nr:siroheme synthase CysG [Woeseiaceae bacterium]